ncbi:hypothetical protein B9T62_15745 [Paenibacillus donghaensis]|uniref:Uncharacterized protein n=1 Tax=Paenibacillus donghaensis TaxID=414771 RepID=A0A2Z2KFZ1_9BACL|nr:hypothetical protein B9T62_15745 [Paenibacillus donghaensis]
MIPIEVVDQALSFIEDYKKAYNGDEPYHIMVNGKTYHRLASSEAAPSVFEIKADSSKTFIGLGFGIEPKQEVDIVITGFAGEIRHNLI